MNKQYNKQRIVHIGLGAFHRAHQALYTELANQKNATQWEICGISLFSPGLSEKLANQNFTYTLLEQYESGPKLVSISSITKALCPARDGIQPVLNHLTDIDTAIVSLTITEKGYCLDTTTGKLDLTNELIAHDLRHSATPKSAIGYLVEALRLRKEKSQPAFTVMPCDNLQENGDVTRQVVLEFAQALAPDLAEWIREHVSFVSTMVDRIVPAVTQETLTEIEKLSGKPDACGLASEGFRQWVIEDKFTMGRPAWELAGAQLVKDVRPFEETKLRLLNGAHSFLAYTGLLAGYQTIFETMQDQHLKSVTRHLMTKIMATSIQNPPDVDLNDYADQLIQRFSNPNIRHKTSQIAMDGSQKIPQRWLPALQAHQNNLTNTRYLALAIAAWIRHLDGLDDQNNKITPNDPMLPTLMTLRSKHQNEGDFVTACLAISSIFPKKIMTSSVQQQVLEQYQKLKSGTAKAIKNIALEL